MYEIEFGNLYMVVDYFSLVKTGPTDLRGEIRLPCSELYMYLVELNTEIIILQSEFLFC